MGFFTVQWGGIIHGWRGISIKKSIGWADSILFCCCCTLSSVHTHIAEWVWELLIEIIHMHVIAHLIWAAFWYSTVSPSFVLLLTDSECVLDNFYHTFFSHSVLILSRARPKPAKFPRVINSICFLLFTAVKLASASKRKSAGWTIALYGVSFSRFHQSHTRPRCWSELQF